MAVGRKGMEVRIQCSCCSGLGMVSVTGRYLDTFKLLVHNPNITGAELAKIADVKPTAMNNRLSWLADKGLATFVQDGKKKIYTATDLPGMTIGI